MFIVITLGLYNNTQQNTKGGLKLMITFLKRVLGPNVLVLITLLLLPVFLVTDNVALLEQMIEYMNKD
ncbi:hypothetical protein CGZ90_18340 [Fictibacillus aquaticus]|uniref:Uncharacterized protein n=1 Tax=Fictibacillus aquaticus TaxID=2021314 RepID=A0A235F4W9_9BACL|nr:hypothetical protein CGZ90_18340 [Fictibacillus aquaticus]